MAKIIVSDEAREHFSSGYYSSRKNFNAEDIAAFRRKDEEGINTFFAKALPWIRYVCYCKTENVEFADEICGDVCLRLMRALPEFNTSLGSIDTFVSTMAQRTRIDHLRKKNRRLQPVPLEPAFETEEGDIMESLSIPPSREPDPAEVALRQDSQEKMQLIERMLQEVPYSEVGKLAWRKSRIEGLTHQEIADELKIPLGTAKTHVLRVNRALIGEDKDPSPSEETHAEKAQTSREAGIRRG